MLAADLLSSTGRWVASVSHPVTVGVREETLREFAAFCRRHGLVLCERTFESLPWSVRETLKPAEEKTIRAYVTAFAVQARTRVTVDAELKRCDTEPRDFRKEPTPTMRSHRDDLGRTSRR